MNFNVAGYKKLIDIVSDSTLRLTSKKVPLVKFWLVSKKNIHNSLERKLKYRTSSFSNYVSI